MKKTTYYLFFSLFILLLTPLLGTPGAPPVIFRFIYLLGVVLITWHYDKDWLPVVIITLFTISKFGHSVAYMPTGLEFYIVLFLFYCIVSKKRLPNIPFVITFFTIWVLTIDLLTSFSVNDNALSLILLVLLFIACGKNSPQKNIEMFSICFISIALVISFEYIFVSTSIVSVYDGLASSDDNRVMWADPNYLGCVVAMGAFVALMKLLEGKHNWARIVFYSITIGFSFVMLLLNASRGALLAFLVGFVVLFLMKRIKVAYKILLFVVIAAFVYWLYDNAYFDLIESRIANDSGGGSGRIGIWEDKWDAFLNKNMLEHFTGIGYLNGYRLAQNITIVDGKMLGGGFHNDFLAHIVDYGIIGVITFISFFVYPFRKCKMLSSSVIASLLLLATSCMTLEPLSLGMYIYYVFWFFIMQLARMNYHNYHDSSN